MIYKTNSVDETAEIAARLAPLLRDGDGILFTGEMGAGKTAFVRGLAAAMGITDHVSSPTFALVNEYGGRLFHFDLFRINNADDLYAIGFYDYLDRGGIFAVEWSENTPEIAEEFARTIRIDIEKTGDSRIISISGLEGI